MSDAGAARQILMLEARAVRQLRATAKATIASARGNDEGLLGVAIVTSMTATALDVRNTTRDAAVAQFSNTTGVQAERSSANDREAAANAALSFVRAWRKNLDRQRLAAGGRSGGGGSSDDWDAARIDTHPTISRIAAWEVVHAWNDEHRRNAEAHPEYRWRQRWCAILDRHLCKVCRAMNGRLMTGAMPASVWPPRHPDCRCFVVSEVIA